MLAPWLLTKLRQSKADVPQDAHCPRLEYHWKTVRNLMAKPTLNKTAKNEAMRDLQFALINSYEEHE